MNTVLVDTSALLALLNATDEHHSDEALHDAGLDLLLDRRKRLLSLVDAVSFVTMRQGNVAEAFAFDPHFEQEGFSIVS